MMNFRDYVNTEIREVYRKNFIRLSEDCEKQEKYLLKKINTFISRYYLEESVDEILDKIKTDKLFACRFIKDPLKQNIYENYQLSYLREKYYPDIKKPKNIYFDKGKVCGARSATSTKSIDFVSENHKIYFAAKHTNDSGGTQDLQYNDLKNFIFEYKKIKDIEYNLYIVVSGNYYLTKMDELNEVIDNFANIKIIDLNKARDNKKDLGQFYTSNYKNVLQGITIPNVDFTRIIEPFVGCGDLVSFIRENNYQGEIDCYDLEPKCESVVIVRDTLLDPPDYEGVLVITNPPYLARNKSQNKEIFDKYNENDLYKCFLRTIIGCVCGGILILPLNFFCNIRKIDLNIRNDFLREYKITRLNIFEEATFSDTSYTICSFSFEKSKDNITFQEIDTYFIPSGKNIKINISSKEKWIIGYSIYHTKQNKEIKIGRLLEDEWPSSNLLLRCIDSGAKEGRIKLEYVSDDEIYYGKISSRTMATITWNINLDEVAQREIGQVFNNYLNNNRKKYNDLFLSNYRENGRKRISFDLAFKLINTAIGLYCKTHEINISDIIII